MMKNILMAFLLITPAIASAGVDKNALVKGLTKDMVASLVDAQIEANCLVQIKSDNQHYIANKKECSAALNSLLEEIDNDISFADEVIKLKAFKSKYGIQ